MDIMFPNRSAIVTYGCKMKRREEKRREGKSKENEEQM